MLVEGDGDEPGREPITAASLMYVRRERPGIGFDAAREIVASFAGNPARPEEMQGRTAAFRLSRRATEAFGTVRGGVRRRPVRPERPGLGEAERTGTAVDRRRFNPLWQWFEPFRVFLVR
jgi:hypothetical protein